MADDAKLDAEREATIQRLASQICTHFPYLSVPAPWMFALVTEAYDAGLAANAERLEEELIATRQSNQENFVRAEANAERVRKLEEVLSTHKQLRNRKLLQLSKSEELTAYTPVPELIAAAQERTQGMVEYYRLAVRDADWKREWDFIERLARSCYLQGAQDTANVAAQMRMRESNR